jgi:NifU-like protein involved in Fe-S cluster formation
VHSPQLLEHFQNPRNVGQLDPPAITVEVSNPACGDILRLSALFSENRITAVRYMTRGCTASIAAGSALTECILHKSRSELEALRAADIELAIGGLIQESKHAAVLCIDAVKALLIAARQPLIQSSD